MNDFTKRLDNDEKVVDLVRLIRQGFGWADNWAAKELANRKKENSNPSCSSCSVPGCCYQQVFATPLEALPIAVALSTASGSEASTLIESLEHVGADMEGSTREDWFARSLPCVFLKNSRCSVYGNRPMVCRAYYVWSEAELCLPPFLKTDTQTDDDSVCPMDYGPVIGSSILAMQGVAEREGLPNNNYIRSLPAQVSAMLRAVTDPDLGVFGAMTVHGSMPRDVFMRFLEKEKEGTI